MINQKKTLSECNRIIKNDGLILITTYELDEEYCLGERIKCFRKIGHDVKTIGLDLEISNGVALHYFTKKELLNLFEYVGF